MQKKFVTKSAQETRNLGIEFVKSYLQEHLNGLNTVLVVLKGDLGAGKTMFTKGIAIGLGLDENIVNSPSYAYVNEYDAVENENVNKLIHVDAWRVDTIEVEELLNLDQHAAMGNVIIVEWHENLIKPFSVDVIFEIEFTYVNEVSREISILRTM